MSRVELVITPSNREHMAQQAAELIRRAPAGAVVTISEPDKSRRAEKKYHALIGDIARCCTFKGFKWNAESWKRLLVESFIHAQRQHASAAGEANPFPDGACLVEGLDGESIVQLGEQTRYFTRAQSSDFIESLYAFGSMKSVIWSEPSKKIIGELNSQKPYRDQK